MCKFWIDMSYLRIKQMKTVILFKAQTPKMAPTLFKGKIKTKSRVNEFNFILFQKHWKLTITKVLTNHLLSVTHMSKFCDPTLKKFRIPKLVISHLLIFLLQ